MNTTQIAVGAVLSFVLVAFAVSLLASAGLSAVAVASWMSHRAVLNPRASRYLFGTGPRLASLATDEA